jgi:hypothetical protein
MKHLWISAAILAALFCATLLHTFYLRSITDDLATLLEQADASAFDGAWEQAETQEQQALTHWEKQNQYLHVFLRHSDIDQIYTLFQELDQFIRCQDLPNYAATNARLRTQLELLYDMEALSVQNIF